MKESPYDKQGFSTASQTGSRPALDALGRVRSEDLLRGRTELVIEHQGREYRLRLTQNGKLILTA